MVSAEGGRRSRLMNREWACHELHRRASSTCAPLLSRFCLQLPCIALAVAVAHPRSLSQHGVPLEAGCLSLHRVACRRPGGLLCGSPLHRRGRVLLPSLPLTRVHRPPCGTCVPAWRSVHAPGCTDPTAASCGAVATTRCDECAVAFGRTGLRGEPECPG